VTYGRAVMVYSGEEEEVEARLSAMLEVGLTGWAMASTMRRIKIFMVRDDVNQLKMLEYETRQKTYVLKKRK
jgi:hypothetical protein